MVNHWFYKVCWPVFCFLKGGNTSVWKPKYVHTVLNIMLQHYTSTRKGNSVSSQTFDIKRWFSIFFLTVNNNLILPTSAVKPWCSAFLCAINLHCYLEINTNTLKSHTVALADILMNMGTVIYFCISVNTHCPSNINTH